MAIAVVLGLIGLWFAFSFKWSYAEMSMAEKTVGALYIVLMTPIYYGVTSKF